MSNPSVSHPVSTVDEPRVNRESWRRLLLAAVLFAVVAFLVTELMHYLLVPDFGPFRERIVAEAASALILGTLAAKLLHGAYRARQHALARLQVIAEVNHHVRNALEIISLSAYITRDEEAIRRIMEGVNRIDWALREILPQESFPLAAGDSAAEPPSGKSARHDAVSGSVIRNQLADTSALISPPSPDAGCDAVARRVL